MSTTIRTASGEYFDLLYPWRSTVHTWDIATALSNICRYGGHVPKHYSVAQHSVLASYIVPPKYALQALMHDAAEAYIGDMVKPLKNEMVGYQKIERNIEAYLASLYGLPAVLDECVKHADLVMLATEKRDILRCDDYWLCCEGIEPLQQRIRPWSAARSRRVFLRRFRVLTGQASWLDKVLGDL